MYLMDDPVFRALSIAVFAIAAFTDFMDGYLARYYGVESKIGIFLDPLADKILTFSGFICLAILDQTLFPWWAIGIILFRDIVITSLRVVAQHKKLKMKTRMTAKIKTVAQMIFLYSFLLLGVFLDADVNFSNYIQSFYDSEAPYYLLLTVVLITLYSGIEYLVVNPSLIGFKEVE